MVKKKGTTIRGRAAKQKGSRAERKVRDMLRSIYPTELRDRVYRVPLSGAGAIKGDVVDNNDYDSCYEVKCQEQLHLHDWWEQTKSQAGLSRTPVLVITQAYRPFYFVLRPDDWFAQVAATEYKDFTYTTEHSKAGDLFDFLAKMGARHGCIFTMPDGEEVIIVTQYYYIEVKTSLYEASVVE